MSPQAHPPKGEQLRCEIEVIGYQDWNSISRLLVTNDQSTKEYPPKGIEDFTEKSASVPAIPLSSQAHPPKGMQLRCEIKVIGYQLSGIDFCMGNLLMTGDQ